VDKTRPLPREVELPERVREVRLEYVETGLEEIRFRPESLRTHWGELTPITTCVRCDRYMDDPNRDIAGERIHEDPEEDREAVCFDCRAEAFESALEADVLYLLEHRLGLSEENKKTFQALGSFIENPDRLIMVAQAHDRVDELERRLEDRTAGIRDAVESKLENANTRIFIAMLIFSVLTLLLGLTLGG
jgi:hypothetical protein